MRAESMPDRQSPMISVCYQVVGTTPGVRFRRFRTVLCPDSDTLTMPVHPRPEHVHEEGPEWHD